jgi:hypothetical protein
MKRLIFLLAATGLAALAGCSRATTFDVSGSVTWKGAPVPVGRVIIEPDAEKGNTGTQTQGRIKDGRYQTVPGQGAISGPVIVTVAGFDGVPAPNFPDGYPLFRDYKYRCELPADASTLDIEVPSNQPPYLLSREKSAP